MAIQIVGISNVTLEPFFNNELANAFLGVAEVNYCSIMHSEVFCEKNIGKYKNADYIFVLIDFALQYGSDPYYNMVNPKIVDDIVQNSIIIYDYIINHTNAKIIWFSYENNCSKLNYIYGHIYELRQIIDAVNLKIYKCIRENDIFVDFEGIIVACGVDHAFDIKAKYRWNMIYSRKLLGAIANELSKQYHIDLYHTSKCIIVDCDNVLWGGCVSEQGVENIILGKEGSGRQFYDFQCFLYDMYRHGVILAICSKNNISDIMRVFRENDEMVLKEEYISCFMVNWNSKASNIIRIAERLNIGLESMVFIDDSIHEVKEVRSVLPEVNAILYERECVYKKLSSFNLKNKIDLEKISCRTMTYKTNELREKVKKLYATQESYIAALEQKVDIHRSVPSEYARIAELMQRTNKCTNGVRYNVKQVKEFCTKGYLYSVNLRDKFSDLGIVGVIGVTGNTLEVFSLSCRALGRRVEESMIDFLGLHHSINAYKFFLTNKNWEVKQKLERYISVVK